MRFTSIANQEYRKPLLILLGMMIVHSAISSPNLNLPDKARVFFPVTGKYLSNGKLKTWLQFNNLVRVAASSVSKAVNDPLAATSSATPITCNGTSTVTVAASGGVPPYTGTGSYTVNAGTYTYTVTDANGIKASTTITPAIIADTEKPNVKAPGKLGFLNDPGQCGKTINNIGIPTVSDNCGIASITNDHPSAYYPVGTTTVTWTVKDLSGNVNDTAKQLITVIDNELPEIGTIANITVNNSPGINGANITLPLPSATDNCGIASITHNHPSAFYPIGKTTVTWTIMDNNGWIKTVNQDVTVNDTEKPVITPMASQFLCSNASNSYSLPALSVSDNAGIGSVSYTISGATTRSGNGNNASGLFNLGVSNIIWTVIDIYGNASSSNTQVTVNPMGPTPVINASRPDDFCNLLTLTATSSSPGVQYDWFLNGVPYTRSRDLYLGNEEMDGVYSVCNVNTGCPSAQVTYQYIKQNQVSNYILLSTLKTSLGQNNVVENGSAGVRDTKGIFEIKDNSTVASYGAFVKAKTINKIGSNVVINSEIRDAIIGMDLPTMYYNTANTTKLSTATVAQNTKTSLSGNYRSLTLKQGSNVTLTGNTFGTIKMEAGVTLTFSSALLNIDNLQVLSTTNGYSNVKFAPNSKVLISNSVELGNQVNINPDKYKVTLYLGDNKSDSEYFTLTASNANITANVYLPMGRLKVNGIAGSNPATSNVLMTGLFIAQYIETNTKVSWNSYSCFDNPGASATASKTIIVSGFAENEPTQNQEDHFQVSVMPNPSPHYFTLRLQSKFDTPLSLKMMDAAGRVIESKTGIAANSTIQIGHNYGMGNYYAEIIQGTSRKTIQLLKVKG